MVAGHFFIDIHQKLKYAGEYLSYIIIYHKYKILRGKNVSIDMNMLEENVLEKMNKVI